jgi:putative ABC transport system ATP-binding protein
MLKIQNLTKVYSEKQKKVTALNCLNLEVAQGDFVALIGPSGCGKSTLLLTLGGMLTPTEGEVWLENQSLYTLSPKDRASVRSSKIGFIFQTFNLIPYLTALQNVQLPLLINGVNKKRQISLATTLLTKMGLEERLHHKPCELSVGQQQREL